MTLLQLLTVNQQTLDQESFKALNDQLFQMALTPAFYEETFAILLNPGTSADIKLNAMGVFYRLGIKECWTHLTPELKAAILSQIPTIIASNLTLPKCEDMANAIVELTIPSGDWSDFNTILPHLFEKGDEFLITGLILSKSMCKLIKIPKDIRGPLGEQTEHIHAEFSQMILPTLNKICQEINDNSILSYVYDCLSKILHSDTEFRTAAISEFGELYFQKFLAVSMENPLPNDSKYINFLRKGIKLLAIFATSLTFNQEQLTSILQFINVVFQFPECKFEKSRTLDILYKIIFNQNQPALLEQNFQTLFELFCPVMALTESEAKQMEEDPCEYNTENQLIYVKCDEIRYSVCKLLTKYMKTVEETQIPAFLYQFAASSIESNEPAQIYVALRLLTSCLIRKYQPLFVEFLPALMQALSNPFFAIRASAFICMTGIEAGCAIPPELIEVCIQHFDDDHKIVAFYSILALKQVLYVLKKQENYQAVKEHYAEQIPLIFQKFIELVNEFNSTEISEGLNIFVEFFDETVLPYCEGLFPEILKLLVQESQQSDIAILESRNTQFLCDALKLIISRVSEHPEAAASLLPTFFAQLTEAFQAINIFDDFLDVIAHILSVYPSFDPSFWGIVQPLISTIESNPEFDLLENVLAVIEQLIYRDTELESRPDIVASLSTLLMNPDVVESDTTIWPSFIMRCPSSASLIPTLLEQLMPSEEDQYEPDQLCSIFSAIAYKFDTYPQELIPIWMKCHYFPWYVGSMLKIFNAYSENPELQAQMIINGLDSILAPDEEIFSDDEEIDGLNDFQIKPGDMSIQKSQAPQWFDQKEIVKNFTELLTRLQESNSPVFQYAVAQVPDIAEKLESLSQWEPPE